jgi:hypothetical protein
MVACARRCQEKESEKKGRYINAPDPPDLSAAQVSLRWIRGGLVKSLSTTFEEQSVKFNFDPIWLSNAMAKASLPKREWRRRDGLVQEFMAVFHWSLQPKSAMDKGHI